MLHVTIRQLQVFATVARHLSFARAAEALHLTPPAVSMQVRQLETQLGLQVFDRSGPNVSLTMAGEYLLVHARRVLGSLKDAENLVARLRRVEAGRLQVGMLGTAKYFLPQLLSGFLREHPAVELVLIEGNRQHLVDLLHRNELDLAIMGRPPRELDTRAEAFGVHPLGIVASPEHRLAGVERVEPAQLADQPFIIRESGSGTRLVMEAYFSHWHISPPVVMRLSSNETIKQAVMANLGLGFLSLHTTVTEQRLGMLTLLPVEDLPAQRKWHVTHIRARTLSPAAEALRYYILERGQGFLARHFGLPPAAMELPLSRT